MFDEGRRETISEIKFKYELEPTLSKTIYVEGVSDKALIEWFLKQCGILNIAIFEIQTVYIEKEELFKLNLNDNNRDRIILLSLSVLTGIIGIIDSDFDFLKEPTYTKPPHLLSTDYSAMELYCFNEETLEKMFIGYSSKQPESYADFLNRIGNILVKVFLIRFAKQEIEKGLKHIDFINKKTLTLKLNIIEFKRDEYLKKYVSNKKQKIDDFNSFIETVNKTLPHDIRKIIHGHDFVALLKFYLGITHKNEKEVFDKLFYSPLDFNLLKEEKMFKDLIALLS